MDVKLQWLWDAISPLVPPMLGALIGLRYAKELSKRDRVVSWVCSAGAGIYLGAAIGEFYGLGLKVIGGAMFIIAMLSSELAAAVISAIRQWAADPVTTFRRWRDAWLGRNGP